MTLKKLEHQFAYEQLAYDASPNRQPSIKLSFFFKKLPDVSEEHFYRHWQSIHSDLTVGTKSFHANKLQRYVQVNITAILIVSKCRRTDVVQLHTSPELKKMAEESGSPHLDGSNINGLTSLTLSQVFLQWTTTAVQRSGCESSKIGPTSRMSACPIAHIE
jgi:hypothetical protein